MINNAKDYAEEVAKCLKRSEERRRLNINWNLGGQDINERWANIRKAYAYELPSIMQSLKQGQFHYHDFMDFRSVMSPIEKTTWDDIKYYGVRLLPEFPVLHYFIDFANPLHKIGLEMDGAQWHDAEKDAARDARLGREGWKIHRITGSNSRDWYYMSIVLSWIDKETGGDWWVPIDHRVEDLIDNDYRPSEIDRELYEGAFADYLVARDEADSDSIYHNCLRYVESRKPKRSRVRLVQAHPPKGYDG